jgi:hypothetical protein
VNPEIFSFIVIAESFESKISSKMFTSLNPRLSPYKKIFEDKLNRDEKGRRLSYTSLFLLLQLTTCNIIDK